MPDNTTPLPARYYPRLSEVVTVDDLPEFLSFVQNGINSVLDKVHYKNLQYSKSPKGDAASYHLDLVTKERLGFTIPGTGCSLILNPDVDQNISSFPVCVQYQWEILAFLRSFSLENFSFSPEEFYRIGLQVFRLSDEQVLAHLLNYFVEPEGGETKYGQLFRDINNFCGTSLIISENENELGINDLIRKINSQTSESISMILFGVYLLTEDWDTTRQRLKEFYHIMVPEGIESYIRKIITPHARVTLGLSAGVELPEKFLRPVDPVTYLPLTTGEKSVFQFAQADLVYDLDKGFDSAFELAGGLNYPVELFKSGMILTMDGLKLDLSSQKNIPEADLDGRPADFKGFYARKVALALPQRWFQNDNNPNTSLEIAGHNLLIGSGGISGTVGLSAIAFGTDPNGKITDYFSQKFSLNYPVTLISRAQKTKISGYTELIHQMNEFRDNGHIYEFEFPLTLNRDNQQYTFYDGDSYRKFLISLTENPVLKKRIGENGFEVGFSSFDIRFRQNKVIESNINGRLKIPGFKFPKGTIIDGTDVGGTIVEIGVKGHLDEEGDFRLTASSHPPYPIQFGEVFTLHLKSVELGKENNRFYIDAACEVEFMGMMGNLLKGQKISISRIRIWSNGRIDFKVDGGSLVLNRPLTLPLGPVNMSVTAIHFGSHERMHGGKLRKYNFFGFDGGIDIGILGIDARGDGVKFYYTIDNDKETGKEPDSYLHISTIKVDLTIPGNSSDPTVVLNGVLNIPEPGTSPEYEGSIGFKIKKLNLSGFAEMKLAPKHPAFYVKAGAELPNAIPLGYVSIYGFQGLIGYRYVAEKKAIGMTSENTWYEYYKAPEKGVGMDKFSGPEQTKKYNVPFSLGLGAIWGTSDGGYIFSANSMILLSLPSMFMIDARMKLLSQRVSFTDTKEPPFFAFLIIGDDALEFGFGADYQLPDNGWLLDLYAEVQARFPFKNMSSWYINFGTREKPIKARVFSLFTLSAYLMISGQGIEVGARGEFNFKRDFKVLKLTASAYLELGGKISFRRPQIGAHFAAGIAIDMRIFKKAIHVYASVNILLGVESPKPFLIYGKFGVKFKVRIFRFFKLKFKATISLKWEFNKSVDTSPINPLTGNPELESTLAKGVSMLTNETFPITYLGTDFTPTDHIKVKESVLPLDAYVDLRTERSLLPQAAGIGGVTNPPEEYVDLIPPKSSSGGIKVRQVKHEYSIESVELQAYNPETGEWVDYHPYEALYPEDPEIHQLKIGQWQKTGNQYNSIRILGNSPFSYTESGEPGWFTPEQYGITESTLFCAGKEREKLLSHFLGKPLDTRYKANPDLFFYSNEVAYRLQHPEELIMNEDASYLIDEYAQVTPDTNPHNFAQSLTFKNYNSLTLVLPEPSVEVNLKLSSEAELVCIRCYASFTPEGSSLVQDQLITEIYKTGKELEQEVSINILKDPAITDKRAISTIEIIPQLENILEINKIREEIAQLFDESYENQTGEVNILTPYNTERYELLTTQLELLTSKGCNCNKKLTSKI